MSKNVWSLTPTPPIVLSCSAARYFMKPDGSLPRSQQPEGQFGPTGKHKVGSASHPVPLHRTVRRCTYMQGGSERVWTPLIPCCYTGHTTFRRLRSVRLLSSPFPSKSLLGGALETELAPVSETLLPINKDDRTKDNARNVGNLRLMCC
jgi:hypothetical protein